MAARIEMSCPYALNASLDTETCDGASQAVRLTFGSGLLAIPSV